MVINLFSVNQEFVTFIDPTGQDSETNREKKSIFSTSEKSDVFHVIFFFSAFRASNLKDLPIFKISIKFPIQW